MKEPLSDKSPVIAVIGPSRCGKDTVARMLRQKLSLNYIGSVSWWCKEYVASLLGLPVQEAWETRNDGDNGALWGRLIDQRRVGDPGCILREMLDADAQIIPGIRKRAEFAAVRERFTHVIWVERPGLPVDKTLDLTIDDATVVIRNDPGLAWRENLEEQVDEFCGSLMALTEEAGIVEARRKRFPVRLDVPVEIRGPKAEILPVESGDRRQEPEVARELCAKCGTVHCRPLPTPAQPDLRTCQCSGTPVSCDCEDCLAARAVRAPGELAERARDVVKLHRPAPATPAPPTGPWIQTVSGKRFYLLDPRPEMICLEDIAHALGQLCRFTGHTRSFLSVAEHSVTVSHLLKPFGPAAELAGLLHDAAEAYIGDVNNPLKVALRSLRTATPPAAEEKSSLDAIEHRIKDVLAVKFDVDFNAWKEVGQVADLLALKYEAEYLCGGTKDWTLPAYTQWHGANIVVDKSDKYCWFSGLHFRYLPDCHAPAEASRKFLERFAELRPI